MRLLWLLLLLPAVGAQELQVDDAQGDVATPIPGTFGAFDLSGLGIEPRNTSTAPYVWGVGIHGGSGDVVGTQFEAKAVLHFDNGSMAHDTVCASLPPACYEGSLNLDPGGVSFWAEIIWVQPDGTEQQMDRVPDEGSVWFVCPGVSMAALEAPYYASLNTSTETDPPGPAAGERTPFPVWVVVAALALARR